MQQSPQGIDAVMAALQGGGSPMGNLGKLPSPAVPNPQGVTGGGMPAPVPGEPQNPTVPGAPQTGAIDPLSAGMNELNPEMMQMIIQALMQQGSFNPGQPTEPAAV